MPSRAVPTPIEANAAMLRRYPSAARSEVRPCLRRDSAQGRGQAILSPPLPLQRKGYRITMEDMKEYQPSWDDPVRFSYRGHEILGLSRSGHIAY